MSLTFYEILLTILVLLGIGALVILVIILKNILDLIKKTRSLVDKKEKEINLTIDKLPGLVENTNQILDTIPPILDKFPPILDKLPPILESVNTIAEEGGYLVNKVNGIIIESNDDIQGIISGINESMYDINKITFTAGNLARKAEYRIDELGQSIDNISYNLRDISGFFKSSRSGLLDYVYILRDFIGEIRRIIFR